MKKKIFVAKRRKREGKTNYKKRLKLLLSHKPRLVIRTSNSNTLIQIIDYDPKGDKTLVAAHSKELEALGWKFAKGNIPAAYLTGLLVGKKAKEKNIKEAVVDLGLSSPITGSRIFAALKGVADQGIDISFSKEILPSDDRIKGQHIAEYKSDKADLPKVFEDIKSKIKVES